MRIHQKLQERILLDLFERLQRQGFVEYGEDPERCADLLRGVLQADLREEEELEEEVSRVIEANRDKFREVPAYQMTSRIRRQIARERGIILDNEARLRDIARKMTEAIWNSSTFSEVYAEDAELQRFIRLVFDHHLAIEERLREEAKKRLRNLEYGSTEYEVQFRRVMDELRERDGLI
jgi:hypothetical protein